MIDRMQPPRISGDGTFRNRFQNGTAGLRETNRVYLEYYDPAARAYQNNSLEEAESLIERALSKDQRQPAFHSLKGFLLLKQKNFTAAKQSFRSALDIDREYSPAYRGLGILSYNQKNYREGIDYLNWSLSLFPQDALSHYFLGMSYFRMDNYKSSIPHLKAFSEVQSKHPEVFGTLGICYEKSGDFSAAYQAYALQVKVAPDNEMGKHAASRMAVLKPVLQKQSR
jgi:tetratricopeptide (TPR) repeat protein